MTEDKLARLINRIAAMPMGNVTLDGRRAVIVGFLNDRPLVETVNGPRVWARFTWEQIERVLDSDCAFKSGGQEK